MLNLGSLVATSTPWTLHSWSVFCGVVEELSCWGRLLPSGSAFAMSVVQQYLGCNSNFNNNVYMNVIF